MSSFQYNQIDWAGVILALPGGTYAVYQVQDPEGHVRIEQHYDLDRGLWEALAKPVFTSTILDLSLRGEVMKWDGRQRPTYASGPLALPPTPGYTGDSSTRPAIGE